MIDLALAEAKKAKDELLVKGSIERKTEIERMSQAYASLRSSEHWENAARVRFPR